MKLRALFGDLKSVFMKHFRPPVVKEPTEVLLIKQIQHIQELQKHINSVHDDLAGVARQLKSDDVFKELDRLAKLAPDSAESPHTDVNEDLMFS
jgi:hypothetical protein